MLYIFIIIYIFIKNNIVVVSKVIINDILGNVCCGLTLAILYLVV